MFKLRRAWFSLRVFNTHTHTHTHTHTTTTNNLSREKVVSLQKTFGKNIFKEPLSLQSGHRPSVLKDTGAPCDTGLDASFSSSLGRCACVVMWGVAGTALMEEMPAELGRIKGT